MSKESTLGVKLIIVEDGKEITWYEEHGLDLINIPGAWAMLRSEPKEGEKKGYGENRGNVALDWLHKNCGPEQMNVDTVPRVIIDSLLKYADNQELAKWFGTTLLKLLQEKFGEGQE